MPSVPGSTTSTDFPDILRNQKSFLAVSRQNWSIGDRILSSWSALIHLSIHVVRTTAPIHTVTPPTITITTMSSKVGTLFSRCGFQQAGPRRAGWPRGGRGGGRVSHHRPLPAVRTRPLHDLSVTFPFLDGGCLGCAGGGRGVGARGGRLQRAAVRVWRCIRVLRARLWWAAAVSDRGLGSST